MKLLKTRKIWGRSLDAFLAAVLVFGAATTAQAAQVWTGNSGGNWATSGNWSGNNSGRRYFRKSGLSGDNSDIIYLSANVTETSHTGLCFSSVPDSGYWRFHGQNKYTFDNSGKTGTDYDQDLICIGYGGAGSSARFYAITLKTRHLTVGGDADVGREFGEAGELGGTETTFTRNELVFAIGHAANGDGGDNSLFADGLC